MYVKRERYLKKIRPFYESDLIKVITGVRRCGKSILLEQIRDEFINANYKDNHIITVNFEDLKYEKIRSYLKLNDYILDKIEDEDKYVIFLDEIQHVKSFEKVLASLRTSANCTIFVTGSNSKLLSGNLATLLVGRCIEFKILPFSYSEAFEFVSNNDKSISHSDFILNYINWGGMPQRFNFSSVKETEEYLKQTYYGILHKDVITDKSKINRQNFERIATFVLSHIGKDFSAKNIENYYKGNKSNDVDKKAIYRYLGKMEKACLIDRVKRFDISGKKSLMYIEKHYACDVGISRINSNFIKFEDTFYLENIVYNELISRRYKVFTGKTYKGEIDFVVIDSNKKCYIQVCYYLNSDKTIAREFGVFSNIKDASPKFVLSLDKNDYSRDGIVHINIVDFLTEKNDIWFT